jgi:hypothetical protein
VTVTNGSDGRTGYVASRLVALTLVATALLGCAGSEPLPPVPEPSPAREVRDAALRTLGAGAAEVRVRVSSATAEYSARGSIELAADRYRVRARVERAPMTHFPTVLEVAGVAGESYLVLQGTETTLVQRSSECWLDPHAPVGALGGGASVQEAMALTSVAVRLLRDGIIRGVAVDRTTSGGRSYRVAVDPAKATLATPDRDEVRIVEPRELARHLRTIGVRVTADRFVRRLSLKLRQFRPATFGPALGRERHTEDVAVQVAFSGFGRSLVLRQPPCIAME